MMRAVVISLALAGTPVSALELGQCDRVTHLSHAGAARHMDHGDGHVSWVSWWAQEGVYTDLHVGDCTDQTVLTSRLREENIREFAFDRREAGADILDRHTRRASAFFSLQDLADDLSRLGLTAEVAPMDAEVCACAAAYPDSRGDLTAFELEDVTSVTGERL